MRRMASEFQGQFMEAMREVEREADLDSVKKEFQAISDQAKIDTSFDPVGMVRDDVTKAAAESTKAPEAVAADPDKTEMGKSEIGVSEISLVGPEPVVVAAPADKAAEPEAPAASRSAAE
jgi:sec-independent protein translocase protein TatB